MEKTALCWVDMCLHNDQPPLYSGLKSDCDISVIDSIEEISSKIRLLGPDLVVFDFDYPDLSGLQALQRTKCENPATAIVMITEQHYENLAVWALRSRVWDYLIKPFSSEVLRQRVRLISSSRRMRQNDLNRINVMPSPPIPVEARFVDPKNRVHSTFSADAYIENHLHEKITEDNVAQLCGMSRYEFSRVFKKQHGLTFSEFIIRARLKRAATLLRQTQVAVTDIAFSVGFHDLSYFSRLFRRNTGHTPRQYRRRHQE